MNPTAEDIHNTPFKKFILQKAFYEPLTEREAEIAISTLSPVVFIKYAEEYSLLKSKEAASEAWGRSKERSEHPWMATMDKQTYMKKYDTTGS